MRKSFNEVFGVTKKQKDCINGIEIHTGNKFNGTTRWEASEFISKYLELSRQNFMSKQRQQRFYYEDCAKAWYDRRGYRGYDEEMCDYFDFSMFT